ncbi:hypothetical protein B0H17DRAFT_1146917 [Mycena rosella]|uniref:DUF6532 domain-containing protein n=1 Tax=Mycena rosella TaxID=1033263 RepID=A0AAD7CMX6_MYCRO|nr:hypothetical protein B0H17DRAFT_1146917 [Mycena rosella]
MGGLGTSSNPQRAKPKNALPAKKATSKTKEQLQLETLKAELEATKAQLLVKRTQDMLDEEEEEEEEEEDALPVVVPAKRRRVASKTVQSDDEMTFGAEDAAGMKGSERIAMPDLTIAPGTSDDEASGIDRNSDKDSDQMGNLVPMMTPRPLRPVTRIWSSKTWFPRKRRAEARTTSRRTKTKSNEERSTSSKVLQSSFSPPSLRLANSGRYTVRVGIATEDGFPSEHRDWTLKTVGDAVAAAGDDSLSERFALTLGDNDRSTALVSYAWGGASQIRGEIKRLCKDAVSLFGIPGTHAPAEIAKIVAWLTSKNGIFKFGGIDMKKRTFDAQQPSVSYPPLVMGLGILVVETEQPYGNSFYQDVITKQFFSSMSSDGVCTISLTHFINLNVPIFALVTDGMENSLKECASGVRINIKFTEEEFGPRLYIRSLSIVVYDCFSGCSIIVSLVALQEGKEKNGVAIYIAVKLQKDEAWFSKSRFCGAPRGGALPGRPPGYFGERTRVVRLFRHQAAHRLVSKPSFLPSFPPHVPASMLILWQTVVLSGAPIHPQDVLIPNSFGLIHQDVVKLRGVKSTASHGLSEVHANNHTTRSCNPINLRFLLKICLQSSCKFLNCIQPSFCEQGPRFIYTPTPSGTTESPDQVSKLVRRVRTKFIFVYCTIVNEQDDDELDGIDFDALEASTIFAPYSSSPSIIITFSVRLARIKDTALPFILATSLPFSILPYPSCAFPAADALALGVQRLRRVKPASSSGPNDVVESGEEEEAQLADVFVCADLETEPSNSQVIKPQILQSSQLQVTTVVLQFSQSSRTIPPNKPAD